MYLPHAFLALLIDHLGHDRKSESYFRLHVVGSKPTGPAIPFHGWQFPPFRHPGVSLHYWCLRDYRSLRHRK